MKLADQVEVRPGEFKALGACTAADLNAAADLLRQGGSGRPVIELSTSDQEAARAFTQRTKSHEPIDLDELG